MMTLQDKMEAPLAVTASTGPRLIVTVDTEEEGLWSGRFQVSGNTVRNIEGVDRFQRLCDELGIRPTYLVDAPVVQDERASAILSKIHADGRCEVGAHVHPWCNPPYDEKYDQNESYLCNLPADVQRSKIEWLTEAISGRFGERPLSFRAGRYGLDIVGARILSDLGYRVDSSVIPFTDYSPGRGPDFTTAPWQPYFVGEENLQTPASSGSLLEVPVSVGFNRSDFSRAMACQLMLQRRSVRWARLEGLLHRSHLLRRIKLSPEKSTAADMKSLMNRYCESPNAVMVMMFHSTSLVPGLSPYVQEEGDLDRLLQSIRAACEYCLEWLSAKNVTLGEMATAGLPE